LAFASPSDGRFAGSELQNAKRFDSPAAER
jgi:hypothetical protein